MAPWRATRLPWSPGRTAGRGLVSPLERIIFHLDMDLFASVAATGRTELQNCPSVEYSWDQSPSDLKAGGDGSIGCGGAVDQGGGKWFVAGPGALLLPPGDGEPCFVVVVLPSVARRVAIEANARHVELSVEERDRRSMEGKCF